MRVILKLLYLPSIKYFTAITVACIVLFSAASARAVTIDFDDLNPVYDPEFPCWCDNPLSDQYLSKGLLIEGAWVNGENSENAMLTSNWAALNFVGPLPTFVSLYVTSQRGDAIFFDASSPSGPIESKYTSGWRGPFEEDTPGAVNELIAFSSEAGISQISIAGFYNMRTEAVIDNIFYSYSAVPEPSASALISLGLFGLFWRRLKFAKRH